MTEKQEKWILKPFNALFWALFALFIVILIAASAALRNQSVITRKTVLCAACIFTFVWFFIYKYCLSIDKEYDTIRTEMGMGGFNWWGELPLHLCNINIMLIPIAVLTDSKALESFCFFAAPLGAFLALAMPGNGFEKYSLRLPRIMGFFGTHYMIFIEGLAIATFGFYKPELSDIPKAMLTSFILTLCITVINILMRRTGLYPNANYFYTIETENNYFLELFYKWIPVPGLYSIFCVLSFGVYMLLLTGLISLLRLLIGR